MHDFIKDKYRPLYLGESDESEEYEEREEINDSNNGVIINDPSRVALSIVTESGFSGENFDSESDTSELGTTAGHVQQGTNMATSGSNVTHRQTLSEEESNEPTPSNREITFNGFARFLEPEEIVGHRSEDRREMLFRVRWRNHPEPQLIESSLMRFNRPQMVMDYLISVIIRNNPNILPDINSL